MSFFKLGKDQKVLLTSVVSGKEVYDLGCGTGEMTELCLRYGAKRCVGLDKTEHVKSWNEIEAKNTEIKFKECYFRDFKPVGRIQVAILSWPPNNEAAKDVIRILDVADRIVYVGKNTDGTMCGTPELWFYLCGRVSKLMSTTRDNALIVYEKERCKQNIRWEEEAAGLVSMHGFSPVKYGSLSETKGKHYDIR